MVDVGGNESGGIEGKVAPTADGDRGFPGQRSTPSQGPVRPDARACLLKIVDLHVAVQEPGLDETNHLLIARNASKFRHRVFEVHILGIKAVGLIFGKTLIVSSEKSQNIHRKSRCDRLYGLNLEGHTG